jgi:hypothetical protein
MAEREQILNRIKSLKGDLHSKIVIQQELSHIEEINDPTAGANDPYGWTETVIDQPEIIVPDEEKRASARKELQTIYQSPESLRVKYNAGRALGYPIKKILLDKLHRQP